jgi:peptidoglycan/LPS O-acetylase OafA/YrhL
MSVYRQKIEALTGLRFFASAAIVVHHLNGRLGLPADFVAGFNLGQGVSLFFVLSGFVLTWRYPLLPTMDSVRRFWLARLARLWPIHSVLLLSMLVVGFNAMPAPDGSHLPFFANLTLVQSWIPTSDYFFSFNPVSWSISTEAGFYVLFPFLIHRFAQTWHWKLLLALLVCLGMVALSVSLETPPFVYPDTGLVMEGLVYVNPLARVFEFVLGMCAALSYRTFGNRARSAVASVVQGIALALLLFNVSLGQALWGPLVHSIGQPAVYWSVMSASPALPSALLILSLGFDRGILSRILRMRLFVYMGEISFAIYMTHYLVITLVERFIASHPFSPQVASGAVVIVTLVLASALYHTVEVRGKGLILKIRQSFVRMET